MDVIPMDPAERRAPGLPDPASDQQDAESPAELRRLAKDTKEFHWKGLVARRSRDLTCEKYMLHVDGEGLSQYLDIIHGTRIGMVARLDGIARAQNNQERPILDNFVAHLTTQPFYVTVQALADSESRKAALIDQALINADIVSQNWNGLWREAKYISACTGFCPIHSMWRDDPTHDQFEGLQATGGPLPGRIDSWVGNPFDTVFNAGSKRGSVHRMTYGRVLPTKLVRAAFPQVKGIEGSTRIVNVSTFQRVIQKWRMAGNFVSGTAALAAGEGHEELTALLYDEMLPGVDPDYPEGCLRIVALQGSDTTEPAYPTGAAGEPLLLWKGPLPAGVFSSTTVYSHHRFDDALGKPYIADIDDDQIELNQLESLFKEFMRRATRPPLAASAGVSVDTISYQGDTVLEIEQMVGGGSGLLQYLEYPARHMPILAQAINRVAENMYRKAGWQAASRGETSGESGKAIIALQTADDSIFGPIVQGTREEVEAHARLNWRLRKQFMDVPMVVDMVGDELAHLAGSYVDRTMMSERPPRFKLVTGFGTSTEAFAQQLLNLIGVTDTEGEPVLTTRQFKRLWPDNRMYAESDDPRDVRERRPRVVNELLMQVAAKQSQQLAAQFPEWKPSMQDPFTAQLGEVVALEVDSIEPALPDDDYPLNIEILSVLTQDPSQDPVVRRAAMVRQQQYFQTLAMQQQAKAPAAPPEKGSAPSGDRPSAQEAFNPAAEGGTATADAMLQADRNFSRRTA